MEQYQTGVKAVTVHIKIVKMEMSWTFNPLIGQLMDTKACGINWIMKLVLSRLRLEIIWSCFFLSSGCTVA